MEIFVNIHFSFHKIKESQKIKNQDKATLFWFFLAKTSHIQWHTRTEKNRDAVGTRPNFGQQWYRWIRHQNESIFSENVCGNYKSSKYFPWEVYCIGIPFSDARLFSMIGIARSMLISFLLRTSSCCLCMPWMTALQLLSRPRLMSALSALWIMLRSSRLSPRIGKAQTHMTRTPPLRYSHHIKLDARGPKTMHFILE